jgi:hypothetical protein
MLRERMTPGDINSVVLGTLKVLQEIRRSGFDERGLVLGNISSKQDRERTREYTDVLRSQSLFPIASVDDIFSEEVSAGFKMSQKSSALCVIINTASFNRVFTLPHFGMDWGGADYVNLAEHTVGVEVVPIRFALLHPGRGDHIAEVGRELDCLFRQQAEHQDSLLPWMPASAQPEWLQKQLKHSEVHGHDYLAPLAVQE